MAFFISISFKFKANIKDNFIEKTKFDAFEVNLFFVAMNGWDWCEGVLKNRGVDA
jgi:hypothetical protein